MTANEILNSIDNRDYRTYDMIVEYKAQENTFGILLMDANDYSNVFLISDHAGRELMDSKKKTLQNMQVVKLPTSEFKGYIRKYNSTNWMGLCMETKARMAQEAENIRFAESLRATATSQPMTASTNDGSTYTTVTGANQNVVINVTPAGNITISRAF